MPDIGRDSQVKEGGRKGCNVLTWHFNASKYNSYYSLHGPDVIIMTIMMTRYNDEIQSNLVCMTVRHRV